jgi:hypothetical protein
MAPTDLETGRTDNRMSGSEMRLAGWTGLEPAASAVTGQRSNQLNYHPPKGNCRLQIADCVWTELSPLDRQSSTSTVTLVGGKGLEPLTAGV